MRKFLVIAMAMLLFTGQLLAQNKTVSGKVTDPTGSPIPGASVIVKGSKGGTSTGPDGSFTITVPENAKILSVSAVGFAAQEIAIGKNGQLEVQLAKEDQGLQEVVVVAYGTQNKRSLTGAATTISPEKLARAPRASIQESFQGNVAGVQAVNGSGQPGSVPNIRIRGVGSINASSAPLYVVDGIPVVSGDITGYNTNTIAGLSSTDIESVTVLKDAAAASLYGSRAANGVVLITTKSGKGGKTKFNASAQYGTNKITLRDSDLPLSTKEMVELLREGWVNRGLNVADFPAEVKLRGVDTTINTDWVDELTRQGTFQQYDLSASGGTEKTTFYLSGGIYKSQAAVIGTDYSRTTAKLAMTNKTTDKLSFNGSISLGFQKSNTSTDAGAFANPVRSFYRLQPWLRVYNPDGTYDNSYNNTFNPVQLAEKNKREAKSYSALGTIGAQYKIYKGLTFETKAGLDVNYGVTNLFWSPGFGDGRNYGGYGSASDILYLNWISTNLLKYKTTFGDDHEFDALVGYEAQKTTISGSGNAASNFLPNTNTLANASKPESSTSSLSENSIASVLSSIGYNYKRKYYLTAALRRDGSSRFGANKRYGNFWSVGASWDVTAEEFFSGIDFLSQLKVRASYGVNGNQEIDNFASRGLYSGNTVYDGSPAYSFTQYENKNLTWETNKPFNIGLDFGILKDRISGSVEYYERTTSNLLLTVPISSANGLTGYSDNVGAMKNKGIEVSIFSRNIVSRDPEGFTWTTDFNFTTLKNKITQLNSPSRGTFNREVGLDFYQYYLVSYAGVNPANGEALWYTDSSRKNTSNAYNSGLRLNQGSALPDFFGGLTNTFSMKGFTLSFQLYYNFGNKIYDGWGSFINSDGASGFSATGKINRYTYENRWKKAGDVTDVPKVTYLGTQTGSSAQNSSRFLYDGDYVRLRDITLSYNLPKSVTNRLKIANARFYVRANNLFTWVKDKRLSYDPEVPVTGDLDQRPPVFKTLVGGIDISL
ncbi:TonB-dependent receptor [Paraflavitalea sp. CAU 1676]|uniref:SusC/RagA family TonB-linked outer membrane protein n=1 Tax=Paraflavitalea sp. CAU 1676 TaxID=3032598 RepID=UPI0023DC2726|nr:TonB-dependent receptor [Paraflavitalea sp. CAU 1676]MDF2189686.1 TonB-dependent receptor [Paraflavitalea sp. CAU 1676]